MIGVAEQQNVFLSGFDGFARSRPAARWLAAIRERALARFSEMGFPTTHQEEWRFTNVAPIARTAFEPAGEGQINPEELERILFARAGATTLVFVNGRYAPGLGQAGSLPCCGTLKSESKALEQHLANYADFLNRPFVALNTAFIDDGAFVHIPKGVALEAPIHIVYASTGGERPTVTHPRTLIVAERGSQATIIESYVGLGEGVYFTNAVTEIAAGENTTIEHYKLELESEQAFHVATLQVEQGRGANFTSHSFALGGALVRNDSGSVLSEGSECTLNGLYLAAGTQHVDNHTVIDHAKPHGTSHEMYKGILDGKAHAVFSGTVLVRPGAQKTDARQTNKNLVLSEDAVINTKPELQIFADDVRCTHGATIGQLDPEGIFYLQSRGIGKEEARDLLTAAFARDIIERVKVEPMRERLERALFEKLHDHRG